MQHDRSRYQAYLQSPEWAAKRDAALLRFDGRCAVCNSADRLEVHHRTYERIYEEQVGDLIALCGDCHAKFHGQPSRDAERRLPKMLVAQFPRTSIFDAKLDALLAASPEFVATWTHGRRFRTLKAADMSLCSIAAGAMNDAELGQLIAAHRRDWDNPDDPRESLQYISQTIAFIRRANDTRKEAAALIDRLSRRSA